MRRVHSSQLEVIISMHKSLPAYSDVCVLLTETKSTSSNNLKHGLF